MPIKMKATGSGTYAPALYCDVCGQIISDIGFSAVVWSPAGAELGDALVSFVHKGTCHDNMDELTRKDWMDTGLFLYRLGLSMGLDIEREKQLAAKLSELRP